MSIQGLSDRNVRKMERATGFQIVRGTVRNNCEWWLWYFTTADHKHGVYNRRTGEWELSDDRWLHTTLCEELFPGWRRTAGPDCPHESLRDFGNDQEPNLRICDQCGRRSEDW